MEGFIANATYKIHSGQPFVYLFGRLSNGESFLAKCSFRPYFFIKKADLAKAEEVVSIEHEDTGLRDFKENNVVKIFVSKPADVPSLRKLYENKGIKTFEADIPFVQRFYIDKEIFGPIQIKGDFTKGDLVGRIYENPKISNAASKEHKLSVLSIDIETDKNAKKIYSVSLVTDKIAEAHLLTDKTSDKYFSYKSEKELLNSVISRIIKIDPDIITGWNVIDFDFKVIERRLNEHKLPFAIGRTKDNARLKIQQDFFKESSADIPGRIVFDGISLIKQAFISFPDYKLDTVSSGVLGEKKQAIEEGFWDNFENIIKEEPQRVAEYNIKDSVLVLKILKKLKLVELMQEKACITGLRLDKVKGSIASLDSLYIRKARKAGYVCPNASFSQRTDQIKGAYVMDPKPGIYDYVSVLDFKSLYPSVICTYNIDPISYSENGQIIAPNGARFNNDSGLLPEIIKNLSKERDRAKKEKDNVKSNAIKIIMNSFYGVLANPGCRFYSLEMGNAITSFARKTIHETIKLIEDKEYEVLYGDTDSVFVNFNAGSYEEAAKKSSEISKAVNRHFLEEVKRLYNRESFLELEFEKVFKVLLLPRIRGKSSGAKKRYAGLIVKDGEEKIKVTGMEVVRRDWTELAKKMQMELLFRVFHKKEVASYIKKIIEDTKTGKYDDMLVYRKSISKGLDKYTKTTPPHVKAARKLPTLKSKIIEYYMTKDGPEPAENVIRKKIPIDYDHYIEKQLRPIADTILELFGMNFDELTDDSGQKNLFDF